VGLRHHLDAVVIHDFLCVVGIRFAKMRSSGRCAKKRRGWSVEQTGAQTGESRGMDSLVVSSKNQGSHSLAGCSRQTANFFNYNIPETRVKYPRGRFQGPVKVLR
jgi:hypothetical protein